MKVLIRNAGGQTFLAKAESNHWVPIDTSPTVGGFDAANNPFQLFVIGCGACAAVDVMSILRKSRKEVTRLEVEVDTTRAETIPKIVRQMCYHVHVDGPELTEDQVRRAIELSLTRYCSASISLDRSVRFRARVTLNGRRGEMFDVPRELAYYEA